MASHNLSRIINALLLIFLLVGYGSSRPEPALAAGTILVNTTQDIYGGSACSLRNAVHAANTNAPFGGCPAGNFIQLPAGNFQLTLVNPSITPANDSAGNLNIRTSMTIDGAGRWSTLVYSAGQTFGDRIFHVVSGDVRIQNMKISGGYVPGNFGGGIYNEKGNLTISAVVIDGNVSGFGGGIANYSGSLSIDSSTISNNKADFGGGIFNLNKLTVGHSTIYNNHFSSSGGGLNNYKSSGIPTATIINTTIAFNNYFQSPNSSGTPSGGGISNAGLLVIQNSTIADNAWAGIYITGGSSLTIQDTILARSQNKPNCVMQKDPNTGILPIINSGGFNLVDVVGTATNPEFTCTFASNDLLNQDAMLTTTMSSHAGATMTYGFVKTTVFSPAIDALPVGDPSCPADDQRGFARPVDGDGNGVPQCDIGAYEERPIYYVNLPVTRR